MDLSKIPRQLQTSDLCLQPSRMEDAEGLFEMLSDPESMKYWSDPPITDISEAVRVLREDIE